MGISNIVIGFFCAAYGAYTMSAGNDAAGIALVILGLVDFAAGVIVRCW